MPCKSGNSFWLHGNVTLLLAGELRSFPLETLGGVVSEASDGRPLRDSVRYSLGESETLPWWLRLEQAHVANLLQPLQTLHFYSPYPREFYSSLPHYARLEHYAFEATLFVQGELRQTHPGVNTSVLQVDHIEYWNDFSHSMSQRALVTLQVLVNSKVLRRDYLLWDDNIHPRKIVYFPHLPPDSFSITFVTSVVLR